jgi:hypothetical protein
MNHEDRIKYLDQITVIIDQMASEFGVTWRTAALRAVSLNLITMQDLKDIQDLCVQEHVAARLQE